MINKFVVSGVLIREDEMYYYTSRGCFNKQWYRLPKDI